MYSEIWEGGRGEGWRGGGRERGCTHSLQGGHQQLLHHHPLIGLALHVLHKRFKPRLALETKQQLQTEGEIT